MNKDLLWFKATVTLFWSSIRYSMHSVSELEPGLGLCCLYNLVVDLQQEAPYLFSAQLKADSDSGVTRTKKKQATWGNPLQNFGCSLQLVKLTLILEWPGQKNKLHGGTPGNILVHRFSWWNWLNIKKAQWGNPLKNYSLYLHLDFLRRPRAENLI